MEGVLLPRSPGHIHKMGPSLQDRWRTYIETQENSVEALMADSYKTLCRDMKLNDNYEDISRPGFDNSKYHRLRSDSFNSTLTGLSRGSGSSTSTAITDLYSGNRSPASGFQRAAFSHGTLPRNPKLIKKDSCTNCGHCQQEAKALSAGFHLSAPAQGSGVSWQSRPLPNPETPVRRLSFSSQVHQQSQVQGSHQHVPAGIAELETMYKAMRNLNIPLPNAPKLTGVKMPAVYPLHSSAEELDNLDTGSILGEIPPPPPPVQSHAVLESGLGHELISSRTPGVTRKLEWAKPPNLPLPPLPPKRTSSRLSDMMRPNNLNLSNDSENSIYSRPKPFRSSLMSTGSSDSGGSSLPSDPELPLSPLTPSSEHVFTWPNYSISGSPEHRSVSQNCDRDTNSVYSGGNSVNTSMTSHSGEYVKMHPVFSPSSPDSPYMNLLYSAVQRQGGKGTVESAMSPYLAMTGNHFNKNIRNLENASIDSVSAIYAQIESSKGSTENISSRGSKTPTPPKPRTPSSKSITEFRDLMIEVERKRQFRVGLNLFNTQPDIGLDFMVKQGFIELSPVAVARFLHSTQDLARSMIGEYLGQVTNAFSMKVLECFMENFDFSKLRIDKALRKFIHSVQIPGEAQKIEKIMEVFGKRYLKGNQVFSSKLKNTDSVVTLSFAIMLLSTDLHTPNLKTEKKMTEKDFINNLKGSDSGIDFDHKLLKSIYKAIKKQELRSGVDHVMQAALLRTRISGKVPHLAEPHRRLVCLCRLAEVVDINTKKEADANNHYRDIWLFNDMMLVTKVSGKAGSSAVYSYKDSFHLSGLEVTLFRTSVYKYGIQISRKGDSAVLATLAASSEHDQYKFVMDIQESIFEMDVMGHALRDANLIK